MARSADVDDMSAIEAFRVRLITFAERCQTALEEIESTVHHVQEWLDHDRPALWKVRTQQAEDALHEAKIELARCRTFKRVADEEPACDEQKTAVRHAKERLRIIRHVRDRVRHFQQEIRQEQHELTGRIGVLRHVLEIDIPRATGLLKSITDRLAAYQDATLSRRGGYTGKRLDS